MFSTAVSQFGCQGMPGGKGASGGAIFVVAYVVFRTSIFLVVFVGRLSVFGSVSNNVTLR